MSLPEKLKVGALIKYRCSRCDLELAHTIMAIVNNIPVRVLCNTCKSERNYRQPKTVKEVLSHRAPRPKIVRPDLYAQKMSEASSAKSKIYRADEIFAAGDTVEHRSFGKGVVVRIIFPDRVEILFHDQSRVLLGQSAE